MNNLFSDRQRCNLYYWFERVSNDTDIERGTIQVKSKMKIKIHIFYPLRILTEKLKMFCCGSLKERDQLIVRKYEIR